MITQFQFFDIYSDIHPFVENTIWLDGNQDETGYLNCSRIKSPYDEAVGHMIACQGPQSNTQDATWRLVL